MNRLLRKCPTCGRYTLELSCPDQHGPTTTAHPAKFSPDDRYARYRVASRYRVEAPAAS